MLRRGASLFLAAGLLTAACIDSGTLAPAGDGDGDGEGNGDGDSVSMTGGSNSNSMGGAESTGGKPPSKAGGSGTGGVGLGGDSPGGAGGGGNCETDDSCPPDPDSCDGALCLGHARPSLAAGTAHTCYLNELGQVACWGNNSEGQLGSGTIGQDETEPRLVEGIAGAAQVSAGLNHTCALLSDRTVQCWGSDGWRQMGQGGPTSGPSTTPITVKELSDVHSIAAGRYHTCALLVDGRVKCWGQDFYGQVGDGPSAYTFVNLPTTVTGLTDVAKIGSGHDHSCALTNEGDIYCWGGDTFGQLGDGWTTHPSCDDPNPHFCSDEPVASKVATKAVDLFVGGWHNCALLESGTVECWGYDELGQLGDGDNQVKNCWEEVQHATCRFRPVVPATAEGTTGLALGHYHSCGWTAGGDLQCWGADDRGQVGDGVAKPGSDFKLLPLTLPAPKVQSVVANGWHTCAILLDDRVQCWGYNAYGQLGNGNKQDRVGPVDVIGL